MPVSFHNPFYLLGIPLIVILFFLWRRWEKPAMLYSDTSWFGTESATSLYTDLPDYLLMGALVLIFIGLARPQRGYEYQKVEKEGIDIVLVMDISNSMRAEDFKPENRLTVAKNMAEEFVDKRSGDRIGLAIFARESMIQAPLTLDHDIIKKLIESLDFEMLEDGTAIGMGVAMGNLILSQSEAENRVMVLLTDGRNNAGKIDPESASEMAAGAGIKIYSIGVGKRGKVPFPVQSGFGITRHVMADFEINEGQLRRISEKTGGEYFRATSPEALHEIYNRIDEMEPTTFEVERVVKYRERMHYAIIPAIFLLIIYFVEPILMRRIP